MQKTTDERLAKIETILNNGIKDAVAENKIIITKLGATAARLDTTVKNLQKQHDETSTRMSKNFSKIYDKIDGMQQGLSTITARFEGGSEKLWHKTLLVALAIMAVLSTINYLVKILYPNAPDMHLFAFIVDVLKALQ